MGYAIQTLDGVTSEKLFKLEKRFVRVGGGEECELRVLNEGAPDAAFLLVNSAPGVYEIRCRSSNSVVYDGRVLRCDDSVVWEVGVEVEIGGCATLRLTDQSAAARTKKRSSNASAEFVDAPLKARRSEKKSTNAPAVATRREREPEDAAKDAAKDDEKTKKKASSPVLAILTIVVCAVAAFGLLRNGGEIVAPGASPKQNYRFALVKFLNDNADALGGSSIFQDYQRACLKELSHPQDARRDFLEIRRKLLDNQERFTSQEELQSDYDDALKGINQKIGDAR